MKYDKPPWDAWYSTARWKRLRLAQLRRQPLCVMCERRGIIEAASVADHVVKHNGDPELFWNGELQSLCKPCHDSFKQSWEKGGQRVAIGVDGWPIDMGDALR